MESELKVVAGEPAVYGVGGAQVRKQLVTLLGGQDSAATDQCDLEGVQRVTKRTLKKQHR